MTSVRLSAGRLLGNPDVGPGNARLFDIELAADMFSHPSSEVFVGSDDRPAAPLRICKLVTVIYANTSVLCMPAPMQRCANTYALLCTCACTHLHTRCTCTCSAKGCGGLEAREGDQVEVKDG